MTREDIRTRSRRRKHCRPSDSGCEEETARLCADGLTTRTAHSLLRAGIKTLEEAEREMMLHPIWVSRIRGFGKASWDEVADKIKEKLGRDVPSWPR